MFDFLCNRNELKVKKYEFEKVFFSKRQGYLEISGKIEIESENGSKLKLVSNDAGILEGEEILISIKTNNVKAECIFTMESLIVEVKKNAEKINKKYNLILQSDYTHRVIEEIIKSGSCNLPCLERAIYHHKLFYPLFRDLFSEKRIDLSEGLPIT